LQILRVLAALAAAAALAASTPPPLSGDWNSRGLDLTAHSSGTESVVAGQDDSDADENGTRPNDLPAGLTQAPPPPWEPTGDEPLSNKCPVEDDCVGSAPPSQEQPDEPPTAPGAAITLGLDDVARFLVGSPSVVVEPSEWTVAGANTNFVAMGAGERETSGTLLGQPVVVHFAPTSFTWVYGDGTSRTTASAGASWQASGTASFAPTPTSHVFAARGSYQVTVTARFSARYRFADQGWTTVAGTLPVTSAPVTVTVKGVKAVLVAHDCNEDPGGIGCDS
jgi:hypothetical protein